jgi:hypothetical protein
MVPCNNFQFPESVFRRTRFRNLSSAGPDSGFYQKFNFLEGSVPLFNSNFCSVPLFIIFFWENFFFEKFRVLTKKRQFRSGF